MSSSTVLVNARLRVRGGFLLTDDEITTFLDAPGKDRRERLPPPMTPSNDIKSYLDAQQCISYMYPCQLKLTGAPLGEYPVLTLIFFTACTVRYADMEITDAGVIPRNAPEQPEDVKERVRRWMQLHNPHDPDVEMHVATTANRIFFMGGDEVHSGGIGICTDDAIADLFAHIGEIKGKKPREIEFTIVAEADDMEYLTAAERSVREELEYMQERAKELAASSGTPPTQQGEGQTSFPWYD